MNIVRTDSTRRPLRLWPGVVAVALQWMCWYGLPRLVPSFQAGMIGAMGGVALGLLVIVWWAFFSRAPRLERWGAVPLAAVAVGARARVVHESIGAMGMGVGF